MANPSLDRIFAYHPPTTEQVYRYEVLRTHALEFARKIEQDCPPSRERSLAITSVQQAVMWANAAIAINENVTPKGDSVPDATDNYTSQETTGAAAV